MFGMVFLAIYFGIALRTSPKSAMLPRPFLQLVLVTTGLISGASRVFDNVHNPSDVILGTIIGTLCALIPFYVSPYFHRDFFPTATWDETKTTESPSTSMNIQSPSDYAYRPPVASCGSTGGPDTQAYDPKAQ